MPIRNACIWVLITDGVTARICSSQDGMSAPLATPLFRPEGAECEADWDERHYRAWFGSESQTLLSLSLKRQFALHIGQLLLEAARDGAYDGLIIIAAPAIQGELQHALAPETRARLIGEVVRDIPNFETVPMSLGEGLCH